MKRIHLKEIGIYFVLMFHQGYVPIVIPDTDSYSFDNLYKNIFEIGVYNSSLKFALHKIALNIILLSQVLLFSQFLVKII